MYEYAISVGEGTLIDHGVSASPPPAEHFVNECIDGVLGYRWSMIIAPCEDDCETGQ